MTSFLFTLLLLFSWFSNTTNETEKNELSLLFIGDIMGHGPQIEGAFVDSLRIYSYDNKKIAW